jgi:hypothetical protein
MKLTGSLTKQNCITTLWHQWMVHRDPSALRKLCTDGLVEGIDHTDNNKIHECETCTKGKMTQLPFFQSETKI